MIGVIKNGGAQLVARSLEEPRRAPTAESATPIEPQQDDAAAQIAALRSELSALKSEIPDLLAKERAGGIEAGRDERDEANRLLQEALQDMAEKALTAWDRRLEQLNGLSIDIARSVLGRILGNPDWRAELVEAAIAAQFRRLGEQAVTAIRLSAQDFPEAPSLAAAGQHGAIAVESTKQVASGTCQLELKIGRREIGPLSQWAEVDALLDELAREARHSC